MTDPAGPLTTISCRTCDPSRSRPGRSDAPPSAVPPDPSSSSLSRTTSREPSCPGSRGRSTAHRGSSRAGRQTKLSPTTTTRWCPPRTHPADGARGFPSGRRHAAGRGRARGQEAATRRKPQPIEVADERRGAQPNRRAGRSNRCRDTSGRGCQVSCAATPTGSLRLGGEQFRRKSPGGRARPEVVQRVRLLADRGLVVAVAVLIDGVGKAGDAVRSDQEACHQRLVLVRDALAEPGVLCRPEVAAVELRAGVSGLRRSSGRAARCSWYSVCAVQIGSHLGTHRRGAV